jgi:hypothetical protein
MITQERASDIYEELPGYPKPPLVPLPAPGDLESLETMGIRLTPLSRRIINLSMQLSGFRAFQKQLPDRLEEALRRTDLRGGYLSTPLAAATLALADDPRDLTPFQRAATLVLAARSLFEDLVSGRLPADELQGQALEMGQYRNLFATSLMVDGKRVRIFKSADTSQILVIAARRLYRLKVWAPGRATSLESIAAALTDIAQDAQARRLPAGQPAVGLLTSGLHSTQLKIFRRLQKLPVNRQSLDAARHSFLTLCLDLESHPDSLASAAFMTHSANFTNRWSHSSLQLIVFGNARACALCNFSAYVDGNPMMRSLAEIQQRGAAWPVEAGGERAFARLLPAAELKWSATLKDTNAAWRDLRLVRDNQQATFEIPGIGRDLFAAHDLGAVPAFILALQMTARRLTGQNLKISQLLSMSKYRCMDLVTAVMTTPAVVRFVDAVETGDLRREELLALMRQALDSQVETARQARRCLRLSVIQSLFIQQRRGLGRWWANAVRILAGAILRILGLYRVTPRQIMVSHPKIYPQVPIVGRPGIRLTYVTHFGLHYQIWDDRVVVTLMPSVAWKIPNAEIVAVLQESLEKICSLANGAGERTSASPSEG